MRFPDRVARTACALALAASTSGCFTHTVDVADFYGDPAPGAVVVKKFQTEVQASHILGLIPLGQPDVKAAIDEEVRSAGGTRARNVKITHQRTLLTVCLTACTFYVYQPTLVTIEGEVVK